MISIYLDLILKLVSVSVFIQSLEMLNIKNEFSFNEKLSGSFYRILIFLNLIACVLIFTNISVYFILVPVLVSLVNFARFKGVFNGGSDYMTWVVLFSCAIAILFSNSEWALKFCFWNIAIQVVASYFVAGLVKIKNKKWRSGEALYEFLTKTNYLVPNFVINLVEKNRLVLKLGSLFVIAFECLFPVVFLSPKIALFFMSIAFVFHLLNFVVFGLNRFVFAWIAGYPALYFLCLK